jgi:TetR/AcrR family acrAB operon transcriptional repressor
MVRRTKEDALATRDSLLDAAEHLFLANGVSGTSLQDIAQAAGVTRGAVYWHFKDKAALFNAMMERVTLPMEQTLKFADTQASGADPLDTLRAGLIHALQQTATDARTRRVFEIATYKVEYVDELSAIRNRHLEGRSECVADLEQALRAAAARHRVRLAMPSGPAANCLHALVDGLIQNWLLEPAGFDLVDTGQDAMDTYLAGLGFQSVKNSA